MAVGLKDYDGNELDVALSYNSTGHNYELAKKKNLDWSTEFDVKMKNRQVILLFGAVPVFVWFPGSESMVIGYPENGQFNVIENTSSSVITMNGVQRTFTRENQSDGTFVLKVTVPTEDAIAAIYS